MRTKIQSSVLLCVLAMTSAAWAGNAPVSTNANGVAAGGYDVTAYRTIMPGADPVAGDASFSAQYKGATWHFVRRADRDRFAQSPEKFSPAFNGHCANALSLGEGLIRTSGKHWLILDDQLYFFFAPRGAKRWLSGDYRRYRTEATTAWRGITQP